MAALGGGQDSMALHPKFHKTFLPCRLPPGTSWHRVGNPTLYQTQASSSEFIILWSLPCILQTCIHQNHRRGWHSSSRYSFFRLSHSAPTPPFFHAPPLGCSRKGKQSHLGDLLHKGMEQRKSVVVISFSPITTCTYVQPVVVAIKMTASDCVLRKGQYKHTHNLVSLFSCIVLEPFCA